MEGDDFYRKIVEQRVEELKRETPELVAARERFPVGSWVRLLEGRQIAMVEAVERIADGIAVRTRSGLTLIDELRPATEEEIQQRLK